MKPVLYDKTGTIKLGELTNCIECLVEEERNGLFEVSLIYPTNDTLFNSLEEENIIVCNANDTLLNQKFRIYMTRKLMSNRIEVFARHISFDLAYDYVDSIDIENQSCEYVLNTIFRNSQFSTHYRGYSDIINAQNYKISKVNCIEAIGGTRGSILDTFGTGAEILRDNTNIHVLNKRGHDNGVSIEYAKNLTGFELEEDYSELITRIIPFASYTDNETNEEILVEANAVDSDLISNYSHPYISYMDFSEKFEDEEIPTTEKLIRLAEKYFEDNECDKPKQNFKIEFVPLSKCVGYEGIQDNISLCDTVTIKDTRFNIDTKAKVIKTVFNVLKNKYESMELGEPRTTLGDIINSSGSGEDGKQGPPGPQGPPGQDGSIGDFPNSLPSTPILSANVYGFASIELNWTYENKVYYNYELYGSKIKDFTPNTFDLIHAGQTSSFLFQAKPNETWYFRVRAINTHGESTAFSSQVVVTTAKVDDMSNYFTDLAIGQAVTGSLTADYMSAGIIKGNWIDAKNLSVTDGNGKRTLDIDSFGNVNLDVASLKISSSNVATETYASNQANNSLNSAKSYTDAKITDAKAELKLTTDSITQRVSSTETATSTLATKIDTLKIGTRNYVLNSGLTKNGDYFGFYDGVSRNTNKKTPNGNNSIYFNVSGLAEDSWRAGYQTMVSKLEIGKTYTFSANIFIPSNHGIDRGAVLEIICFDSSDVRTGTFAVGADTTIVDKWQLLSRTFTVPDNTAYYTMQVYAIRNGKLYAGDYSIVEGDKGIWSTAPEDIQSQIDSNASQITTTNSKVVELTTNLNSITSRVSSTESTLTNTTSKIDNLQVGGRNFVTTSNKFSVGGGANGITSSIGSDGALIITTTSGNGNWFTGWAICSDTLIEDNFNEGDPVTISFTMKSPTGTRIPTIYFKSGMGYYAMSGNMSTNYSTVYCTTTWKKANPLAFHLGFGNAIGTFYIKNWKIEKGNKPTGWTPALEDMETTVSNLTTRVSNAESKLTKDSLTTTIGNYYTTSTDVDNAITSKGYATTSQVQQTANDLTATFKSSGGYNRIFNSYINTTSSDYGFGIRYLDVDSLIKGKTYTLSINGRRASASSEGYPVLYLNTPDWNFSVNVGIWESTDTTQSITFTLPTYVDVNQLSVTCYHYPYGSAGASHVNWVQLTEGSIAQPWSPHPSEIYEGITRIDKDGIQVSQSNISTTTKMNANGFYINKGGTDVFKVDSGGLTMKGNITGSTITGSKIIGSGDGNRILINNADYEIQTGGTTKGFFGLRTLDDSIEAPRLAMGPSGISKENHNYFVMTAYPWNNNPLGNGQNYIDMAYRTQNYWTSDTTGDVSNIRMLDDGDIHIAPVRNLLIKTSFNDGVHNNSSDEQTLAEFRTSGWSEINNYLKVDAVIREQNTNKGLVLGSRNTAGNYALTRITIDDNNYKFFAPLYGDNDMSLGSPSYLWSRVCAVNGTINTSDRNLKNNIEYIQETQNPKAKKSNEYSLKDMYDFVKDYLSMATYTMKDDNEEKLKYGFIAQDIVNTKIGENIVYQDNEGGFLGYDTMNYTSAIAGALKQAINEIENLKKEIEELKADK